MDAEGAAEQTDLVVVSTEGPGSVGGVGSATQWIGTMPGGSVNLLRGGWMWEPAVTAGLGVRNLMPCKVKVSGIPRSRGMKLRSNPMRRACEFSTGEPVAAFRCPTLWATSARRQSTRLLM